MSEAGNAMKRNRKVAWPDLEDEYVGAIVKDLEHLVPLVLKGHALALALG